ncbi:TPA: hypothetical protein SIC75_001061 [Pasteurella multocida]|uniref:hypothetical protein n=1 Tax=Pasteurella TaxID=745 RepID=UPI0002145283|nr:MULTISPECIES: hypothetical protein [Pasteurella]AWW60692.1 hypothetical protein C4O88_09215 [Pasteurellaceae bacterium 12591]EGP03016.1 hypothetical protein AAUPMG_11836 [Pasteurella multocida subsp. multocida str. Anand1_goat]EGP03191.1 hypothetical protein GEW_12451 [Pasteurella multocida subsp. gallicida str. Anand1_poultry]AIN47874.1 hypothetical protein DR93_548 [Pasteurella multocida]AMM82689.1 hypothetical protein AW43_09925 [Pasteurella multocida subsp. multocida PMTB2.1]
MQKFSVIYKFSLTMLMLISVSAIILSGLFLYFGINFPVALSTHLIFALLFICSIVLHLIHRRSKLKKIHTQFFDWLYHSKYPSYCTLERLIQTFENLTVQQLIEEFQLSEPHFLDELRQVRIQVLSTRQTLRQACHNNDEKIFLCIDIAMRLKFSPNS